MNLNKIIYAMVLYSLDELSFSKLNDENKRDIKEKYKRSLLIK